MLDTGLSTKLANPNAWRTPEEYAAFKERVKEVTTQRANERRKGFVIAKNWDAWLTGIFPAYVVSPMAERHVEFWDWVWELRRGVSPRPFVAIWPRGGAKSTSAELACVAVGALRRRRYIWYVCETQDQADRHVETIGDMLEMLKVEEYYPALAQREVGKYGHSRGWRRSRLRSASGLTIDAIGLDTARRGARVREARPDMMVFDDLDGKHDSKATTEKKKEIITTSLLPAGSNDRAVLMVQNLIHGHSIFAQLADGRAEFLYNRIVSGPHPAIEGLTYRVRREQAPAAAEDEPEKSADELASEKLDATAAGEPAKYAARKPIPTVTGYEITGGTATWEGQSIEICQTHINEWGLTSFLQEAQHDVSAPPGGIWDHVEFQHVRWDEVPDIVRGCVWVDPAVTEKAGSDSHAIQADGISANGTIYRFYSWESITSPEDSLRRAILKALELKFTTVGVETDQGGDAWRSVYREAARSLLLAARVQVMLRKAIEDERELAGGVLDGKKKEQLSEVRAAVKKLKAEHNLAATNGYGDVFQYADDLVTTGLRAMPRFQQAKAGAGHGSKVHRNSLMLTSYDRGEVVHVEGTHEALESALRRFPLTKPFDLVDAAYWSWADLKGVSKGFF